MSSLTATTIDRSSHVNYTMGEGEKTIHEAIIWNDIDRVKEIINRNPEMVDSRADVRRSRYSDEHPEKNMTPLHTAVWIDRMEIAEYLISKGADIRAMKRNSRESTCSTTPFKMAVALDRPEFVKMLLRLGIDVNERNPDDNTTALHTATYYSRGRCAEILLDAGADVNARSKEGWTPLHNAANKGYIYLVELLISRGADINAQVTASMKTQWENDYYGEVGDTPLHFAVRERKIDVVKVLLNRGADVNLRNSRGGSPMQLAQEAWRGDSLTEILLNFGAIAEPMIAPPEAQSSEQASYPPYQSQEQVFTAIYSVIDNNINTLLIPAAEEYIIDKQQRDDFLSRARKMIDYALLASLIDTLKKLPYSPNQYNVTSDCKLVGDFRMTMKDEYLALLFATAEICHKAIIGDLIKTLR